MSLDKKQVASELVLEGDYQFKRFPTREYVDFVSCFEWQKCKNAPKVKVYLEKCNDLYHTVITALEKKVFQEAAKACEVYICYVMRLMKQSTNMVISQRRKCVWASTWKSFVTTDEVSYRSQNFMFEITMSWILLANIYYVMSLEHSKVSKGTELKTSIDFMEKAGWVYLYASKRRIGDDPSLAPEYNQDFCNAMAETCFAQAELSKLRAFTRAGTPNYDLLSKMASSCVSRFGKARKTLESIDLKSDRNSNSKPSVALLDQHLLMYVSFREIGTRSACFCLCGLKFETDQNKNYKLASKYYQNAFDLLDELCGRYGIDTSEDSEEGKIGRQCYNTKSLLDSANLWEQVSSEKDISVPKMPEEKSAIVSERWAPYNDSELWPTGD